MTALTAKQAIFVNEYLIDMNASAAYRRAGYKAAGNVAEVGAHHLLRNPKVAATVAAAQAARAERTGITADQVLRELATIGFSDIADVVSWEDGRIELVNSASIENSAAVFELNASHEIMQHG